MHILNLFQAAFDNIFGTYLNIVNIIKDIFMTKENSSNKHGQISKFYQTELISSEECGVYLGNSEIYKISQDMGFDITLATNEFILAQLFREATEANRADELNGHLKLIFEERLEEYNKIKSLYPKASEPISTWIDKCKRTISKLQNSTDKESANG